MHNILCICHTSQRFSRGHEEKCVDLKHLVRLTRVERAQKREMKAILGLPSSKLTSIDFLLNRRQVSRVIAILLKVRDLLRARFAQANNL